MDTAFDNQLSGGIGVDGTLEFRELKLTTTHQAVVVQARGVSTAKTATASD